MHAAAAHVVGAAAAHRELESGLLRTQLELDVLSPELALRLAEHGMRDDRLAGTLRRHLEAPNLDRRAKRLAKAAVAAGAVDMRAVVRSPALAEIAAAAPTADELLTSADPDDRATAVRVAASVAAHDGNHTRPPNSSTGGPQRDAVLSASAVVAFIGVGDLAPLGRLQAEPLRDLRTAAARAVRNLADGPSRALKRDTPLRPSGSARH